VPSWSPTTRCPMDKIFPDRVGAIEKQKTLNALLKKKGPLMVAFSGGVDSAYLLAAAYRVLGGDVVAATATSEIYPNRELESARAFARSWGIEHITIPSNELTLADFIVNGPERCYHCKKGLFQALLTEAERKGIHYVAHGANVDDLADYRPGFKAANELNILAPLIDAGLKKEDVRFLAKTMHIAVWNKPSMACLASRIPYGSKITVEKLKMVEEAENFLRDRGISQCRVRHHGPVARIELKKGDLDAIMKKKLRDAVVKKFREIGFFHISVDLEGHTSGNMNRELGMGSQG
jgi:pyridinium-3,5-biscarboxylic acid mononucleotide sulfurtransferase